MKGRNTRNIDCKKNAGSIATAIECQQVLFQHILPAVSYYKIYYFQIICDIITLHSKKRFTF
jgi:hypothetical protein